MEEEMDEGQNREYQTVVLAGLLHDIGKRGWKWQK